MQPHGMLAAVSTTLEQLVQRARELGASVGQAAVDTGDHERFVEEGDDPDELRCNLWTGSPDGERSLRRAVDAVSASERVELPADEVLWDQLYDAWNDGYEARVRELVGAG